MFAQTTGVGRLCARYPRYRLDRLSRRPTLSTLRIGVVVRQVLPLSVFVVIRRQLAAHPVIAGVVMSKRLFQLLTDLFDWHPFAGAFILNQVLHAVQRLSPLVATTFIRNTGRSDRTGAPLADGQCGHCAA